MWRFAVLTQLTLPTLAAGGSPAADPCVVAGAVNVSCYGFDALDSTSFIQAALDSAATTIYLDDTRGYMTRPLHVNTSHKHVVVSLPALLAESCSFHKTDPRRG